MRQGAARHALKARGDDFYETPAAATRALLRAVELPRHVWEPCAGRGAIARELVASGREVVASDIVAWPGADPYIVPRVDFLLERAAPAGVAAIVTNPPFKLADAFVRHGLSLGLPTIALLRLMAIEGAGRADLIDGHLRFVYAGIERLPTMHREGWAGKRIAVSSAPFAWFVFHPERREGEAFAVRRISWRGLESGAGG